MTVKVIVERFNIYNDPKLDMDHNFISDTSYDIPKFLIRFYVKSPCFSENVEGNYQFSKKYRRRFNEIKTLFCKEYGAQYDRVQDETDRFDSLETLNKIVKALEKKIETSFIIPGQIELSSIELMGLWDVCNPGLNSKLRDEFEEQIFGN